MGCLCSDIHGCNVFGDWIDPAVCVNQVENLEPYIERKLFSVNTGHATVAYAGAYYDYQQIDEAIQDERVLELLKGVLHETSELLLEKWGFEKKVQEQYAQKIVARFKNPYISDSIQRVPRTPIRKLGYDERFIRPIRELAERKLAYNHLIRVVGMILTYEDREDEQSVELQEMLKKLGTEETLKEVTKLENPVMLMEMAEAYQQLGKE